MRHKTIGVIVPETISHYYAKLATTLEDVIYKHQYHTIISITDFDLTKLTQALNMMVEHNVEGIIVDFSASRGDRRDALRQLPSAEFHWWSFAKKEVSCDRDCVYLNYQSGVQFAIQHLLNWAIGILAILVMRYPCAVRGVPICL